MQETMQEAMLKQSQTLEAKQEAMLKVQHQIQDAVNFGREIFMIINEYLFSCNKSFIMLE